MGLTLRYSDDAFDDPDWHKKAWAVKWLANNHCQLCSCRLAPGCGHVHHNTYAHKGNERPHDLIALCDVCHATHHWFGKFREELVAWIRQRLRETGEMSARLEMIGEWIEERLKKALQSRCDDVAAELVTLEAAFSAEREYDDGKGRRAA